MNTATMYEYRIKQDEMFRQAENFRLIIAAQKSNSPADRLIRTLKNAIGYIFSS